jgi:hypothetical protein
MTEDHTLAELMEDLKLQSELHDKETLKQRREDKLREKEHKDEVKLSRKTGGKRQRVSRKAETEDERRLRKYPQAIVESID